MTRRQPGRLRDVRRLRTAARRLRAARRHRHARSYPIDGRISDDGSTAFRAETGRYHLYYSYYCPWAQRPMIALKLRGLDGGDHRRRRSTRCATAGAGRSATAAGTDPTRSTGSRCSATRTSPPIPTFAGHISVPALWDRATNQLVSNHYATMTVDLETRFADCADPSVDLLPDAHRDEINAVNAEIVTSLATGAYAAMASTTQAEYDAVSDRVFAALERFDARLAERRFLVGDGITDADLLLYVQLVRFDVVAVPLGRLTRRRLVDYPNLWAYARDLYQRPAFRETTDFDHIDRGTFGTGAGIRTHRDRARHARRRLGRSARPRRLGDQRSEEPGEAELVAVGVAEVEVALAPGRVRGTMSVRTVRTGTARAGVDVGDPEDHTAPDRGTGACSRSSCTLRKPSPAVRRERRVRARRPRLEPQRGVERARRAMSAVTSVTALSISDRTRGTSELSSAPVGRSPASAAREAGACRGSRRVVLPILDGLLAPDEQLRGLVPRTEQSTFSGHTTVLGVTDQRWCCRPSTASSAPRTTRSPRVPRELAGSEAASARRDVEQADRLVAQSEAGGEPRRLCVGGFRRDQRVPHVVGERVEEGVEPFGHWVPLGNGGDAGYRASGRAPWDCDQGSDRLVTTAPSVEPTYPAEYARLRTMTRTAADRARRQGRGRHRRRAHALDRPARSRSSWPGRAATSCSPAPAARPSATPTTRRRPAGATSSRSPTRCARSGGVRSPVVSDVSDADAVDALAQQRRRRVRARRHRREQRRRRAR